MRTELSTSIFTAYSIEGLHRFPRAAVDKTLAGVSFLANPHRHTFGFTVAITVMHDDREIEFLSFRRWLRAAFGPEPVDFGTRSCEAIGRELHGMIAGRYPGRGITVRVDEDGENGAEVSS